MQKYVIITGIISPDHTTMSFEAYTADGTTVADQLECNGTYEHTFKALLEAYQIQGDWQCVVNEGRVKTHVNLSHGPTQDSISI